jgi:hypothetical protein
VNAGVGVDVGLAVSVGTGAGDVWQAVSRIESDTSSRNVPLFILVPPFCSKAPSSAKRIRIDAARQAVRVWSSPANLTTQGGTHFLAQKQRLSSASHLG